MKDLHLKIIILFVILLALSQWSHAQLLYNNGVTVQMNPNAIMQVNGNAQNQTGTINIATATAANLYITGSLTNNATINGYGNIHLNGDWINNNVFNSFTGLVSLEGGNQNLSGSVSTSFYNLNLLGSNIKTQTINEIVTGTLDLFDRELATNTYTMFVTNSNTAAIQRTTGFISSNNGGYLSRTTSSAASYLFPVGSSIGIQRYRPVELTPATAGANTYIVRMANLDASTEGYNRTLAEASICQVNPLFYHQINRSVGSDAIDIDIFFDPTSDGTWDNLGTWHTAPSTEWYTIATSTISSGVPFYTASESNWNDFSQIPYALVRGNPTVFIGNDTTICSNSSVTLDAGSGYDGYNWNTGFNGQSITVNTNGNYSVTVTAGTCTDVDTISITVIQSADATITPAGPYCYLDAPVNLTATDAGGTWSGTGITNTTLGTFDPGTAGVGTYTITYGISGQCGDTASILITVDPQANATITPAGPYCTGASPNNLSAVDPGGTWAGTGITDPNNGTFNPVTAGAGTHEIIYTITGSCGDADTISITVIQNADATITPAGPYCILESPINLTATDAGGTWSGTGITNTALGTFDPGIAGVGTYTITYGISGQCGDTASILITVDPQANATITPAGPYCDNEAAINLSAIDPGGIWAGTGITNTSNGTYDPTSAGSGLHEVIYTISGLCGDSDTIDIRIWETPNIILGATDETCQGENDGSAWVEITGGTLPYSILWENSYSTDTIYDLTPGYWTVLVNDSNSCVTGDSIMIFGSSDPCYIPHIYVPNIFSPNGDGNNDILLVRGDGIEYLTFIIYDRWGEEIFESSSLSLGWDGTFNGKPINPGVFVYYLNATFLDGSEAILSGNITLVR